jgi:sterol desaturase/sphingolipid hydroxylase (fatty acid hydroxylase superfamily)
MGVFMTESQISFYSNYSDWSLFLLIGGLAFLIASARYLLMTALYYWVVYKIFQKKLFRFKIKKAIPSPPMIHSEMYWGLLNNVNFAIIGIIIFQLYRGNHLSLFPDFHTFSWLYHGALMLGLLLLHDTYFYWIHWLMHNTSLGVWLRHDVHHQPENVSPWSAFSVHPFEGFLEVIFRLFTLWLIPMHIYDFIFFEILTFGLNIIGHSGYEFFPSNFAKSPLTRFKSCATFHFLHHKNGRTNLSLFFNHWDRWMGTLNPEYETFYKKVTNERKEP